MEKKCACKKIRWETENLPRDGKKRGNGAKGWRGRRSSWRTFKSPNLPLCTLKTSDARRLFRLSAARTGALKTGGVGGGGAKKKEGAAGVVAPR
jgi:hypothetical protein